MNELIPTGSNTFAENNVYYPSLLKRFVASFIDSWVTFIFIFALFSVAAKINNDSLSLKIIAILFGISYEPFAMRFSRTIGQILVGIKVKSINEHEKAPLLKSYMRYVIKSFLGWIAYTTIHSNDERRAIHDIVTDTVVIDIV